MNANLYKFLVRMSKITLYAIVVCQSLVVALANESSAQRKYLEEINVELGIESDQIEIPLNELIAEVEASSDFHIAFTRRAVKNKVIHLNSRGWNLLDLLKEISIQGRLSISRVNETITLIPVDNGKFPDVTEEVAVQVTVSGKVTDENGEPLPGATVIEKGTSNGTITDVEGNFSLNVSDDAILKVSFVGYVSIEYPVNGQSQVDISLVADVSALQEVVVIGYGSVKRADLTGAVSSIGPKDFNRGLAVAPEQLMQGKVAGVNIIQNSGQPGAATTVRIRGSSSVSAGNDPLYVIDGVPMQFGSANEYVNVAGESATSPFSSEGSNPLNTINPSDIESIEILKDASAAAIYGSRGANGVIIITTKGQASGEAITYNTYVGASYVPKQLEVLSASEYRGYAESNGLSYPDEGANTNWQDEIFRTGFSQNHNLSFGGGSNTLNYRASVGYNSQEGVIRSSGMERYTARLNASHTAMDGKLQANVNLTYGNILDDIVPISSNIGNEGGNVLKDAIRWAPTLPVKNPDGSFYQIGELRVNPVSWAEEIKDERNTNLFLGNLNISYNILEDLKLSVNLGRNDQAINRYTSVPATHPIGQAENGRASISKLLNSSSLMETNLTYTKELTGNSSLTILAGYSFQRFTTENTFSAANQFVSTSVDWNLLQSGNTIANTSFKTANRLVSQYARINYKLLGNYLFTATIRRDGSSRFGGNNQYGLFPSGAFAWKISDEAFFSSSTISNLKLRVGYGVTGNQEIPDNLFREQLSISGSSVYVLGGQTVPSVLPSNYPNPDLKWETTSQTNVGLDFGLWGGRISGSMNFYKKHTTDLLLEFPTAAPSVVATQWANVGAVDNTGFELTLDGNVINTDDLLWKMNLNFSTNKNEVVSLSNDEFSREEILRESTSGVVSNGVNIQIITPGEELGTFYGRKYTGQDAEGLETYLDEDGVDGADLVRLGTVNPDFTYGFSNSVFWKNFDLSVSIRGVAGNKVYNNTAAEFSYVNAAPGVNVLKSALDLDMSRDQISQFSSRWIENGSYLRLDNINIGYTFQTENIDFLSNARIYVTGQNLFVITKYTGFDPEVRTNTNRGGTPPLGIDYLSYPRPRVFMLGASLSF